jgi:TonB family protein
MRIPARVPAAVFFAVCGQLAAVALQQPAFAQPSRVAGEVRKPIIVKRVVPQCRWWKPHRRATSSLEVTIWKDGQVHQISVVRGPETAYTAAAEEALRKWQFRPATLNGQPVDVLVWFRVRGCWLSDLSYSLQDSLPLR